MFGYNPSHLVGIVLTGYLDEPHVVSKLVFHRCDLRVHVQCCDHDEPGPAGLRLTSPDTATAYEPTNTSRTDGIAERSTASPGYYS